MITPLLCLFHVDKGCKLSLDLDCSFSFPEVSEIHTSGLSVGFHQQIPQLGFFRLLSDCIFKFTAMG